MKYYAVLPVRRNLIQDTGELFLLALVDEENLSRCLYLINQERKIQALQKEIDELAAKAAELEKVLARLKELEKEKVDNRNFTL